MKRQRAGRHNSFEAVSEPQRLMRSAYALVLLDLSEMCLLTKPLLA